MNLYWLLSNVDNLKEELSLNMFYAFMFVLHLIEVGQQMKIYFLKKSILLNENVLKLVQFYNNVEFVY